MSNTGAHPDGRFFDEVAALMMPWGWPRPVGRMYAYLLVQDAPVTLDQIAADLAISKSNASVAARTLEVFGNAHREAEPGSKRIWYSAPDIQMGPFASRVEMMGKLVRLVDAQAPDRSPVVTQRLANMADFFLRMGAAMQRTMDETVTTPATADRGRALQTGGENDGAEGRDHQRELGRLRA